MRGPQSAVSVCVWEESVSGYVCGHYMCVSKVAAAAELGNSSICRAFEAKGFNLSSSVSGALRILL